MKNYLIALLGFAFLLFTDSCRTSKNVEVSTPVTTTEKVGPTLQPLAQIYVRDLSKKDSALFFSEVRFYNRTAINLALLIFDKEKPFSVEDGVAHKKNTDIDLVKTVPEMTPGKITSCRFSKGNSNIIVAVTVAFDLSDKTYELSFFRTRDNPVFELNANATVVYKDQKYPVVATIPSNGKACILMFYGDENQYTISVKENARGVLNGSGPSFSDPTNQPEQKREDDIEW